MNPEITNCKWSFIKWIICIPLVILITSISAQQHPVSIRQTEVRTITSKIVEGQEYELQVMLPASYNNGDKEYPVVYVMDSQWDFPLLTGIYGQQYYDGFIPELIIVGVTWSGENANYDSLRKRDYSPTHIEAMPQSGGADRFLKFMKEELFPFVESNYKADNKNRILMGCSGGAVFTLYTLFTQPELFTGYAAATPYIPWDNEVLYKFQKAFSKKRLTRPVRLYMTMGDVELTRPAFEKFAATMRAQQNPSLHFHSRILENTGHSGTKNETYARGLQYIFERPKLKLATNVLNHYVGTYQLPDGNKVKINNKNGQLALLAGNDQVFGLYATSEIDFYATAQSLNIHFKNLNGKPEGFWLEMYGSKQFAKKVM